MVTRKLRTLILKVEKEVEADRDPKTEDVVIIDHARMIVIVARVAVEVDLVVIVDQDQIAKVSLPRHLERIIPNEMKKKKTLTMVVVI